MIDTRLLMSLADPATGLKIKAEVYYHPQFTFPSLGTHSTISQMFQDLKVKT